VSAEYYVNSTYCNLMHFSIIISVALISCTRLSTDVGTDTDYSYVLLLYVLLAGAYNKLCYVNAVCLSVYLTLGLK